jgi:hypothetical protein
VIFDDTGVFKDSMKKASGIELIVNNSLGLTNPVQQKNSNERFFC